MSRLTVFLLKLKVFLDYNILMRRIHRMYKKLKDRNKMISHQNAQFVCQYQAIQLLCLVGICVYVWTVGKASKHLNIIYVLFAEQQFKLLFL